MLVIIQIMAFVLVIASALPVASEMNDGYENGIADNPCAYTECIINTTCISVIDPDTCIVPPPPPPEQPCRNKAMCIPNGQNGEYPGIQCGSSGEKCPIGYACEFVQVMCITTPCPQHQVLICVDKTPPAPAP